MTSTDQNGLTGLFDSPAQSFVLWCLKAFGFRVVSESEKVYRLEIPRQADGAPVPQLCAAEEMDGRRFTFAGADRTATDGHSSVEQITFQSELMAWLLKQLGADHWPMHAAVARQPISVRELAEHLFTQYQVEDGQIHLAGCRFEDRPFLRLSYVDSESQAKDGHFFAHCFASADGKLLDKAFRDELELESVIPLVGHSPRLESKVLQQWVDVIAKRCQALDSTRPSSPIAATLIWCKYAVGKLAFSIGRTSVELPFSGWAKFFSDRRVIPPPFTCPLTGKSSYHLAATDDGQITVAEAISVCAKSGRRVLDSDLESCSATGHRVLSEFLQECPVSGERTLQSMFQSCETCHQDVSPSAIVDGQCTACHGIDTLPGDDPRLNRIRSRFPELHRWRGWKISETATVYVLVGSQVWQRMLLVLDKQTLDVLRVAGRSRLSKDWVEATPEQRTNWLSD